MSTADKLRALRNRRKFLADRLDGDGYSPSARSYAAAEADALDWALRILTDYTEHNRAEASDPELVRVRRGWISAGRLLANALRQAAPEMLEGLLVRLQPEVQADLAADADRPRKADGEVHTVLLSTAEAGVLATMLRQQRRKVERAVERSTYEPEPGKGDANVGKLQRYSRMEAMFAGMAGREVTP